MNMRLAFAVLVALLACPVALANADPALLVADSLPYTLHEDPGKPLSLLVYSTEPLSGLRVAVKELKDPDGQSLPATGLEVSAESAQINEQGVHIYLRPDLQAFRRPGDYLLVLLLSAAPPALTSRGVQRLGPPTSRLITLTLRREAPQLQAQALAIRLTRPMPWRKARLEIPYFLENRGQRPIRDLAIDVQPFLRGGGEATREGPALHRSELAPGSMLVVLPPPAPGEALKRPRTAQALELSGNSRLDFNLLLSELSEVGRFETGLTLRTKDLREPQSVRISIEVVDRWEFALLAILCGVFWGAMLSRLGGRFLRTQYVLSLISLPLAGLSGVYLLCYSPALALLFGSGFGTPIHYLTGLAWGFGLDVLLRAFADILVRLSLES